MCPEEGTYLAHRQWNSLLRLLPREHAHFGVWREHRGSMATAYGCAGISFASSSTK